MMGNILTYIWEKFSSLFNLFPFGQEQTDEDALTIVKAEDKANVCQQRATVNREVIGQSHEKILSKVIIIVGCVN